MASKYGLDRLWLLTVCLGAILKTVPVFGAVSATSTDSPGSIVPVVDEPSSKPAAEVYTATDASGKVCTLASLEATIVLWPNEPKETRIEMPTQVSADGPSKCPANPGGTLMSVAWSSFQLCFYMSKADQSWTLDKIGFVYNASEIPVEKPSKLQKNLKKLGIDLNSAEWQFPIGSSYRCTSSKEFQLIPLEGARFNATLILSQFQIQPFLQDDPAFGEEVVCADDVLMKRRQRHRDATVTIAVGSSLASLCVVTVLGYAIYRHVKIKSFGYGTMN